MDLPIIIFHLSYKEYACLCLKQAKKLNKTVILITDAPAGGDDDNNTIVDTNFINTVLIPSCVSGNIRVLVVLPTSAIGSSNYFPLVNLANLTGGQVFNTTFDQNFSVNGVITALANLC